MSHRVHWPEALIEAAGLGAFMVSACVFGAWLEDPASTLRALWPALMGEPFLRRCLMGFAMGATAVAILYSPWGKRSGAHINPAVTLAFWRLGRIAGADAVAYAAAQFAGGAAGVALSAVLLGSSIGHPAVRWVVTVPGPTGAGVALVAELLIGFAMMAAVLTVSSRPRAEHLTGLACATMLALDIAFESPLSGTSLNPARTFASAIHAGVWTDAWIYFVAPPLGMLAAAELYLRATANRPAAACSHPPCAVSSMREAAARSAGLPRRARA